MPELEIPSDDDLVTREQAAKEFRVTVGQLRYLAQKGRIHNYKRGPLPTVYVSRKELGQLLQYRLVAPDEDIGEDEER